MRDFATTFAAFSCTLLLACSAAAAEITVRDADGKDQQPLAGATDQKPTVLIFLLRDCPVCNAFAPEIERINKAYAAKGVRLNLVYTDEKLSSDEVKQHTKDYSLTAPALIDSDLSLAAAVKAKTAPEAVVIGSDNAVRYRGRINDLYAGFGKKRAEPTRHDLRDALDALLAGKPVAVSATDAIGCNLPEKRSEQK